VVQTLNAVEKAYLESLKQIEKRIKNKKHLKKPTKHG